jgi:flagellar protein FlaG
MELFSNVVSTHKESYTNNVQNENHKTQNSSEINKTENINDNNKIEKEEKKSQEKITKEKLQELTQKLNKEMEPLNPDIKFNFNDKIDNFVVNVIDKKTDRVIRKFPPEEALKIMEKMRELVGALFDKKG